MDQLRADRGNKCNRCPSRAKLEFAHLRETGLKGRSRGGRDRYYDIRRNPDAYELMCQRCHRAFDLARRLAAAATPTAPEAEECPF